MPTCGRSRAEESSVRGYEHEFERAAEELRAAAASGGVPLSDAQKIRLYGLFKQATEGDCRKPQPSAFQPVERAKWKGWQGLAGLDATTAKRRYVLQVLELVPSFKMPTTDQTSEEHAAVSTPAAPVAQSVTPVAFHDMDHRQPPQQRTQQHPHRTPVPADSYAMIVLELVALGLGIAVAVAVSVKVLVPMCHRLAKEHFGNESCRPMFMTLAPVLWFGAGYVFVVVVRSKMFSWRLLSGEFVWLSAVAPIRRLSRRRQPRPRRHRDSREEVKDVQKTRELRELGIHLVLEPEGTTDRWSTPRVELVLPPDADAMSFGHATLEVPYTVEQTADVYYRKFKEPLPDPANHLLVALELEEERRLEEWDAVYRRRVMRFRNATPYLIKRFVSSEYVEYVEHSLMDYRNRVFYVYIKNRSFESLGTIEDYSIYHAAEGNTEWTTLTQSARVHITSSSVGFFRSQVESFISTYYGKKAPESRQYHLRRLTEEFGSLTEGPTEA